MKFRQLFFRHKVTAPLTRQQRRAAMRRTEKLRKQSNQLREKLGRKVLAWIGDERIPQWIREAKARQLHKKGWI